MTGRLRSATVAACLMSGLTATPANALTYIVVAEGTGKTTAYVGNSFTPTQTLFNSLRMEFSIPDATGSSSATLMTNHGLGFLDASNAGLRMSFNGSTGVGAELLSGNACGASASGLPTASVGFTPNCGSVTYSAQGKYRFDEFVGKVVSFDVVQDGYSGSGLFNATIANVPEPASWLMMIVGFGSIGVMRRRYRASRHRPPATN